MRVDIPSMLADVPRLDARSRIVTSIAGEMSQRVTSARAIRGLYRQLY